MEVVYSPGQPIQQRQALMGYLMHLLKTILYILDKIHPLQLQQLNIMYQLEQLPWMLLQPVIAILLLAMMPLPQMKEEAVIQQLSLIHI